MYKEAFETFNKLADQEAHAMYPNIPYDALIELGQMHILGEGVKRSTAKFDFLLVSFSPLLFNLNVVLEPLLLLTRR